MKKIVGFLFLMFFLLSCQAFAQTTLLRGSVEKVPENFFGTWRVSSARVDTDSPITFKEKGVDIWNLSQVDNVIKLSNPFSGAMAEINVENASVNSVTFTKVGKYDAKILTDKVKITINEDKFVGTDELILDTLSDVDGTIRKTETAKYTIKGERIAE
jgi:hypothetical protein